MANASQRLGASSKTCGKAMGWGSQLSQAFRNARSWKITAFILSAFALGSIGFAVRALR